MVTGSRNVLTHAIPITFMQQGSRIISSIIFMGLFLLQPLLGLDDPIIASIVSGLVFLLCAYLGCVFTKREHRGIGIIDFCWYAFLSIILCIILSAQALPDFLANDIPSNAKSTFYSIYHGETKMYFQKSIDSLLIIGTVLAVCMSILWGKDIWRKPELSERIDYLATAGSAIKMVIAYISILISVLYWITLPLYERLTTLREALK